METMIYTAYSLGIGILIVSLSLSSLQLTFCLPRAHVVNYDIKTILMTIYRARARTR